MHLQELKSLESEVLEPLSIPVIGRCLQKKAVMALAEDNSPDAVKVLAKAVTRLKDEEIKDIILNSLGELRNQRRIDAFCQVWADTRHRDLTNLLVEKGWVASRPLDIRVLSALKAKHLQVITNSGKEIVEPLLKAFQDKDSEIANRASECAISITNPEAIDYICQQWAETKDKLLEQLVCKGKYVAQQPIELRVLTALKLTKLEVIRDCGKEIAEPLMKAFNDKDSEIANKARECAISLTNQEAIDYICQKWAEIRDKTLEQLIYQGKYTAQQPIELRVLTALKLAKLEVIRDYSKEIVESLLNATQDKDSEIANRASECATMFDSPKYQELICRLVIESDHSIARQVAINAQYAPREPSRRALFYFLTEQWDKYESLDYEHTLLQTAFEYSNEQLRQKITEQIRKIGRVEWVKVIAGGHKGKRLGAMTDAEWEATLTILSSDKRWEEMWRLAQKAPPIWSKQLLQKLKQEMWIPKAENEREVFEKLKQLSDKCLDKIQLISGQTDCQATLTGHITLTGHTHIVNGISFSPDGKILASSSLDKTIRLWQMPNGKLLRTLTGHTYTVNGISFSPDGKILASSSSDKTIRLWQMPDGRPLATLSCYTYGLNKISFSNDGQLLASCSNDKTIRLWQIPDGRPLATLNGHTDYIQGISFSPNGKILASYSNDKTIRLWQIPDGRPLATLNGHTDFVRAISFSPNGKILASSSNDKTIRLWQMPDGRPLAALNGHTDFVSVISFSNDGLLASCSDDKTIRLWQIPYGQTPATLTCHTDHIQGIGFSPDGKILASYSNDKTIKLWSSLELIILIQLSRLPIKQLSQHNREQLQKPLQDNEITEEERHWLEFMQALINWHQRFDVEVEDAPQVVNTGEFDIEIEG